MTRIRENLQEVWEAVEKACAKAGRRAAEIQLLAVTKTAGAAEAAELFRLGVENLAENRVQSLLEKAEKLPQAVKWHLIGHLQTNKVKYIVDKVALIHSVDSLALLAEIDRIAAKKNVRSDVLLQINVAEEPQKFGMRKEELPRFLEAAQSLAYTRIRGLMTVAPLCGEPEENRGYFAEMYRLFAETKEKEKNLRNAAMDFLSMGMSGDYAVAAEEGANMLRIGRALFAR
jgi:pyridoxal phosphate enzyme (YggS family)